uniref:class I SAM-dependent methyltransferase n=1 Tax=Pararhizobium sp. IMCC3301 TaxID=3067904 RepID=UPI0027414D46|nr:class I SAM-dependent methyltransferase [Pararhizobium sp. IMCC3301]
MIDAAENGIYLDPDLARFYDLATTERADFNFCRKMAATAASVLDLGCGTGELAVSLAEGREVCGVDPASAMLEIARARAGADQVDFSLADARSVRLSRKFDLVVLTGHSFQVFLTDADQIAVLATIAAHLNPGGRFVFDSRNLAFPGSKTRDSNTNKRQLQHPEMGPVEAGNGSVYDEASGILSYENSYRIGSTGQTFSACAQIRYTSQPDIADKLRAAGLTVERWLGDWQGGEFEASCREIIPIGGLT